MRRRVTGVRNARAARLTKATTSPDLRSTEAARGPERSPSHTTWIVIATDTRAWHRGGFA
jgi:hypothetical protein